VSAPALLSVVIPVCNEAESLLPLYEELGDALLGLREPRELIFVDDGSSDATPEVLRELAAKDDSVVAIRLRRNFGQTAATMAGLDHARGAVVVVMDGDGQNDPHDIPALLDELARGYDVVSGWRRERQDGRARVWLSRAANWLVSRVSGVPLHDQGCSLKAYRREVIRSLRLYGEMHRFIALYASWMGARVSEIPVHHRPRAGGASHYGFERVAKVFLDLLVVLFLGRYATRPMYVFGGFGLVSWGLAGLASAYALYRKLFDATSFIQTPLPLFAVMAFITGVLSMLMGLVAELLVRTYYESQQKTPYAVAWAQNLPEQNESR
jgi:glycosyltransferase involved in cell wall biosynthesis